MSEMLKPAEVAKRLGLSLKTVNRMLANNVIPSINLSATGNLSRPRRRVMVGALEDFINKGQPNKTEQS